MQGLSIDFRIVPFRGIHLTRMIDGGITVGPNAVLAAGREAYFGNQFDARDIAEMAGFTGFWRRNFRCHRDR